jgi:hypothetical protein
MYRVRVPRKNPIMMRTRPEWLVGPRCLRDGKNPAPLLSPTPFTTATAAVNISNFPGSVKTSRRRLRNTELRNHAAARLCSQTKRSSSRRTMVVLGCIDHETADMMNATLNRPNDSVAFLLTYGGGFLLLVLG